MPVARGEEGGVNAAGGRGSGDARWRRGKPVDGEPETSRASVTRWGLGEQGEEEEEEVGRLYVLVQNLLKTLLGRNSRVARDFMLAQVLNTHETPVALITLLLTDSA